MDELTDTTISNSEDRVDITGKGGRIIGSLKEINQLLLVELMVC